MKCNKCKNNAVFKNPNYCKKHFIEYIEKKVLKAIKDFKLINKKDKIVVAVSGGKDSISCLHIINKYFIDHDITGLAIDEGISDYRDTTLIDLKRFCKNNNIKLKIVAIKKHFEYTLDELLKISNEKPCTVCGAIRRYLINIYARKLKATKLATGHNADDEAQSTLMNYFRNQLEISARLGPITGIIEDKRFVQRIKPLYFCTEKEITAYSFLMNFQIHYMECPYSDQSYRNNIQEELNNYEIQNPGTKQNILKSFLKMLPDLKNKFKTSELPNACETCGEPAMQKVCKVCQLMKDIKKINNN